MTSRGAPPPLALHPGSLRHAKNPRILARGGLVAGDGDGHGRVLPDVRGLRDDKNSNDSSSRVVETYARTAPTLAIHRH